MNDAEQKQLNDLHEILYKFEQRSNKHRIQAISQQQLTTNLVTEKSNAAIAIMALLQPTPPVDIEHDIENSGVDIDSPVDGELQNQVIQFQKDTLAEWDNPAGRNVDMIKLAERFTKEIAAHLQAAIQIAELKKEIKIHDNYWHLQRTVEKQGIGPVALEFKEAAEKALQQLNQGEK